MTLADGIALGGLIVAFGAMTYRFNGVLDKHKENLDDKVRRNYKRMDEVKLYTDETYTRKDICGERHTQITNTLKEINSDVKKLLTKNGIE